MQMTELKLYAYLLDLNTMEIKFSECVPEVKPATYVIPNEKSRYFGFRRRICTNETNCAIPMWTNAYMVFSEDGNIETIKKIFKEKIDEKFEVAKKGYEKWNKCVSDFEKVGVVKCE